MWLPDAKLLCGSNGIAKDKDEHVVEVIRPVPQRIGPCKPLLSRDPWSGTFKLFNILKIWNPLKPEANLWHQKPDGRHQTKSDCPTKPPSDRSFELFRIPGLFPEEVKPLEMFANSNANFPSFPVIRKSS